MNKNLQSILTLIEQSAKLSDEEKKALSISLKAADKELEITSFKLDRTEKVKRTTAILLEETIEELEKKRKDVVSQNRELEIESSLERVRTIAMSMNCLEDMVDVCRIISQQLELLNVKEIRNVQTAIFYEEKGVYMDYEYYAKHDKTFITEVNYTDHAVGKTFAHQMLKGPGEAYLHGFKKKEDVLDWYEYQKTTNVFIDTFLETADSLNYYWYSLGPVALGISTYHPLDEKETDLFKRFLKVFELSYRRYIDIEKAIAQAREAQIQLALERVRARTMAMQKSDELPEAANLLFQQVQSLGMPAWSAGYGIWNDELPTGALSQAAKLAVTLWMSSEGVLQPPFKAPTTEDELFMEMREGHEEGKIFHVVEMGGDKLVKHYQYMRTLPVVGEILDSIIAAGHPLPSFQIMHHAYFSKGFLLFITTEPVPDAHDIFKRFANVFEQTYTRFLDLQKAESQAREAKIEVAVERVRAKALAMHNSEEITGVARVLRNELGLLHIEGLFAVTIYLEQEDETIRLWDITIADNILENGPKSNWDRKVRLEELHPRLFIKMIWDSTEKYFVIEQHEQDFPILIEWVNQFNTEEADEIGRAIKENNIKRTWFAGVQLEHGRLSIELLVPPSDEIESILSKTGAAFDLAYKRFLDLQKAEAQAREAQIELALERVRARTMAMQKSDELREVVMTIYEQLQHLDFNAQACNIVIADKITGNREFWVAGFTKEMFPESYKVPYFDHPYVNKQLDAWKHGEKYAVFEYSGKMKNDFDAIFFTTTDFKNIPDDAKRIMIELPSVTFSTAFFNHGSLQALGKDALSTEHADILRRFAKVFEQTYTRFLDLQKAEAQTKEAQIEAALEKVRSRTMAMQSSNELQETAAVLFNEFKKLGTEDIYQVTIGIYNEEERVIDFRVTSWEGSGEQENRSFSLSMEEPTVMQPAMVAWKANKKSLVVDLTGEALEGWLNYRKKISGITVSSADTGGRRVITVAYYSKGHLSISSPMPVPAETIRILERFAAVFDSTYTRFLDLQKAETQAREAQVEVALERVRAKTMAMHNSEDVSAATSTMFTELEKLGVHNLRGGIAIISPDQTQEVWSVNNLPDGTTLRAIGVFDMRLHPFWLQIYETHKRKANYDYYWLSGQDKQNYIAILNATTGYLAQPIKEFPDVHIQSYYFGEGAIWTNSLQPHTEEQKEIMKKFASVFSLTFRRYKDLQKAEAQARESQIEAALEKIRSRSLAMHHSDELRQVVAKVYTMLSELKVKHDTIAIQVFDFDAKSSVLWPRNTLQEIAPKVVFPYDELIMKENVCHRALWEAMVTGKSIINKVYTKEQKDQWFEYIFAHNDYTVIADHSRKFLLQLEILTVCFFPEKYSGLYAESWDGTKYSDEDIDVLRRASRVFEQAYVRFLDLQKAEAQAKEAQLETALEKVRSRTMAMFKSEELSDVAEVLFTQVSQLGELPDRISIGIIDETNQTYQVWATDQAGSQLKVNFVAKLDEKTTIRHIYTDWKAGKKSTIVDLQDDNLKDWIKYLQTELGMPILTDHIQGRRFHNVAHFSQGWLNLTTSEPLGVEAQDMLQRFSSVFNLTYTRFLDLQKAEAQAREAQIEAALERVRSRSMGMQKSEELKEVIKVVYDQFVHLKIHIEHTGFIIDYKEREDMHIWLADRHEVPSQITIPYFDSPHWNSFIEAKAKGSNFFANHLSFAEKNKFYQNLFNLFPVPEATKEYYFNCPGLAISTVLLDNIGLYIENFSGFPYTEEENNTLMRFGKVFQQTYTRFKDLEKAEAQARDAKIEIALERIRARALAMHTSNDLLGVCNVLREQMGHLGQPDLESSIIHLYNGDAETFEAWYAYHPLNHNADEIITDVALFSKYSTEWAREVMENYKSSRTEYTIVSRGKKLFEWYKEIEKMAPAVLDYDSKGRLVVPEILYYHFSKFSGGTLLMISNQEPSAESRELQRRAALVFDLAYTRFLDLQKAEAQAREAQIELALERVRARTMAMQQSVELQDTSLILFEQLKELGEPAEQCTIGIIKELEGVVEISATFHGNKMQQTFRHKLDEPFVMTKMFKNWKDQQKTLVLEIKEEELQKYNQYRNELVGKETFPVKLLPGDRWIIHIAYFSKGMLALSTNEPRPAESLQLLERFAIVFEQTYIRFLDLQKAEAQAREAQIQLSLERVRARGMAMHSSNELADLLDTVFKELTKLDVRLDRCIIMIYDPNTYASTWWLANPEPGAVPVGLFVKYHEYKPYLDYLNAWKERILKWEYLLEGVNKKEWDSFIFKETELSFLPEFVIAGMKSFESIFLNVSFNNFGSLTVSTTEPLDEANADLLLRFAKVFDSTYTRFNDLQKAEAQAREAQIETGLERVRSRSMGMQKSEELKEVIQVIYDQFVHLKIKVEHTGFVIDYKVRDDYNIWVADPLGVPSQVTVPYFDSVYYNRFNEAKVKGEDFFATNLSFEEKNRFYKKLFEYVPGLPEQSKEFYFSCPGLAASTVLLDNVCLYIENFSAIPYTDKENNTLMRFGKVFQQTYTRFLDLQKAETQAREVIKRASVDRVRAEIASMRTTLDLERIIPLIWNELITLGVPFIRCGVFIMDEVQKQIQTLLSTPEGKSIASFQLPYDDTEPLPLLLPHWQRKEIYTQHWDEAAFIESTKILMQRGVITESSQEQYTTAHRPTNLHLHFLPFLQGMLYVGSEVPLSDDEVQLAQNLADAFSTAYARYEDFNKLEAANNKIEKTLVDLKQAQSQLVQSEKMASLGELTAGIAHEIQNPLNFVNNFASINAELIDEMKIEIDKGNTAEVKVLANDILHNEQKIMHHGKRAESIVKGMLQHSRKSTGVKEPTDINALCDEFVRLSYHGLRAKDKTFNAEYKLDLDPKLPLANVVSQDIGRVLLNIINNAFQACSSEFIRCTSLGIEYHPKVNVSTMLRSDNIEIRITDNGPGIPPHIKDKIFQPFFTTKPTGQGTGLGLSLAYDIVKAHGGELKVETKEGEGSTFIIQLPNQSA